MSSLNHLIYPAVFLLALCFLSLSTFMVIQRQYESRKLVTEIRRMEKQLHNYELDWQQLQLEVMTLTDESRVENVARKALKMKLPLQEEKIYLKQ